MKSRWGAILGVAAGGALVWQRASCRRAVPLRGRVAIVTGASSGIGRATAHAFARAGAAVVLAARREERLQAVATELSAYDAPMLVVPTDVSREDDLDALVARALACFGRIDVLVNNAGIAAGGPFETLPPARLEQLFQTNLYGPLRLTQRVLPTMLEQGSGHIVNVSSGTARSFWPGLAAYATTRAGLTVFSQTLRRELLGTGVRVSVVMPGWTRTAMFDARYERQLRRYGFRIDPPERPARAILDAVRYNRSTALLGGPLERGGYILDALAPWLLDRVWRLLMPSNFMELMHSIR